MLVSRFAPAPTGHLHLGHVVNAIYVWGVTKARGGRVIVRIEDHDGTRSRRMFEASILGDLAWLGFVADGEPVRQSGRGAFYESALATLREKGLVYACRCSRQEIAAAGGERPGEELRYPGTCRTLGIPEGDGVGTRVRLDRSEETFIDLRRGFQMQVPSEQGGDLLVRDRDGHWTYQFAVAVDDLAQGVTLVIRGDDLLASTGRQIQLARLLGRERPPRFLHHPLVMKGAGQKISKSDGDTGISELRARGWDAPRVIGHAAWLVGLIPEVRPLRADDASALLSEMFRWF